MKNIIKKIVQKTLRLNDKIITVVIHPDFVIDKAEIIKKVNFFFLEHSIVIDYKISNTLFPLNGRTFHIGFSPNYLLKKLYSGYLYDINKHTNPDEAWQYHYMLQKLSSDIDFKNYQKKFIQLKSDFKLQGLSKAYFFGTGPSLIKAINSDWSDGIRIVCNTIVKDEILWKHLNPHIIVAGDAIYHFGVGKFAVAFREDLKNRLKETPKTYFVYPSIFHPFCLSELSEYSNQLVPVPIFKRQSIDHDLTLEYFLPNLPNVLPLLGLPIACSFSSNIFLWGFDGKAPNDEDFWKNSDAHFYQSLVPELKMLHPAFYKFSLSSKDANKYSNLTQGDHLDRILTISETKGFSFNMLHESYTETLAKRFIKKI